MSPDLTMTFDDACQLLSAQERPLDTETVPLAQAAGRILAADVTSDMDMPPFDKSAMDGYACRQADLANPLRVIEVIPAGQAPRHDVGPNECSKIMTGAAVPSGADCVVQVELTSETDGGRVVITVPPARNNICRRAEDIRAGDTVLEKGTRIEPQHIGVLATVGCTTPVVACRPVVGVITTGDEIVEPDHAPAPAQIRNSNGHQLTAQVQRAGASAIYYGIVPDTEAALNATIQQAIVECDVLLLSGGVSMGDFDLVPGVLKANGFDLLFEKLAIKPGKPTVFGVFTPTDPDTRTPTYCFGLPGNPVSTFVIFEILVRPFLEQLMGCDVPATVWPMQLDASIRGRNTRRDAWIPVAVTAPGRVAPISYHGSAHLNALITADGLICLPRGTTELPEGAVVDVRPI